ncbi:MarC family NAAT transporter [Klebsiella aerogenes]|uniref:UPF0056 membrane protein n=1 Tax=Klebsiella aerogenes TaxID=548 RepID=A0AAP9R1Y4_KLEAE|nr:MarC family NAAT transporter [Klebsiella aerogenes]QMR42863.1 MarC family NAAT transporter [Klebsiella aerogenes]
MIELIKATGLGLVIILPLANPLTAVVLYLCATEKMSESVRRSQSLLAAVYVFLIMSVAYYGGQIIISAFGISLPGLRIAGGLIVMIIGFSMLFPAKNTSIPNADIGMGKASHGGNIAFVPLAMPGTAGPGTIAMIISAASTVRHSTNFSEWVLMLAPVLVFIIIALLLWLSLRGAGLIMRIIGSEGIDAISRLMGFLLACMGVQFIINGILELSRVYHG